MGLLGWAIAALVIALISGSLGYTGVARGAASVAYLHIRGLSDPGSSFIRASFARHWYRRLNGQDAIISILFTPHSRPGCVAILAYSDGAIR